METTYTLRANEINQDFFEVFLEMKRLFKNKIIRITVSEEETDTTNYLLSNEVNKMHIEKSINDLAQKRITTFKGSEFEEYTKKLLKA